MTVQPYQHHCQYYETDQTGIIHHSNYIRWFEEARIDYLKQVGLPYEDMEKNGIISPVLEVSCQYKKMIKFQDTAPIILRLKKYTGIRFEIEYQVYNQHNELCTTGYSQHCFLNKEGKPLSLKRSFPHYHHIFEGLL